jgi:hypothetical protein
MSAGGAIVLPPVKKKTAEGSGKMRNCGTGRMLVPTTEQDRSTAPWARHRLAQGFLRNGP